MADFRAIDVFCAKKRRAFDVIKVVDNSTWFLRIPRITRFDSYAAFP
jgi:hypothetical protein